MFQIERPGLSRNRLLAGNLAVFGIFLATSLLSLCTTFPDTMVTVFWPPAGLTLVAMFRYGRGLAPGVWAGAFVAAWIGLVAAQRDLQREVMTVAIAAAVIASGALVALLLGCQALERFGFRFRKQRHVGQVAVLLSVGLVGSLISAIAGVAGVWWAVPAVNVFHVLLGWWISCSLGVFLFAPLAFAWWGKAEEWRRKRRGEAIVCLTLLVVTVLWAVFGLLKPRLGGSAIGFMVLPFLTWAAVRLGYRATTTALVLVAGIAIFGIRQLAVVSSGEYEIEMLFLLAARLLSITPTTLCVAAVVYDRVETELLLQQTNQNLEAQVNHRTNSLKQLAEQLRNEVEQQKVTEAALRESRERLELAVHVANVGYWDADLKAGTVHYSPEWKAQLGYRPEELMKTSGVWRQLLHPEDREAALKQVDDYIAGRTATYATEFRLRHKDGSYRWIHSRASLIKDANGTPVRLMGCHLDITQQKEAERALRESSERLRLALDVAQMGTWDLDLEKMQTYPDARLSKLFGGPGTQPLCRLEEFLQRMHPEDALRLRAGIEGAAKTSGKFHQLFRVIWSDQTVHWLEAYGTVFPGGAGQPARLVGATVDVTERQQAEEALRRSERQYAELVNHIDGIVWEADVATLRMTFVSHQAENILGYPASEWISNPTFWQDHIHPDDRETAMSFCSARTSRGEDHNFEYRMIAADGRAVWLADFVTVVMEQGRPVTLRGIMVDITRRKELEHEQARSYSLLQATLESSQDGLLVVDREGVVRDFNQRFLDLWRLPSDLVAQRSDQRWLEFVTDQLENPEDFLSGVQQLNATPEQESYDVISFRDGRVYERYSRPQRLKNDIIGRVWSFRDVTERRRNERLLLGQTKILEDIARGVPLEDTLTEICRTAENSSPGLICSVLLVDEDREHLRHGVAPSFPEECWRAFNGIALGPNLGSCGAAVQRRATVIVEDIAVDPVWDGMRAQALAAGLRSCWSTPIFDPDSEVIGSLAFYYPMPRRPTSRERRTIEMATHAAAIAILKDRADQQLARSARVLRQLSANLMNVHETERRHLARELHDEVGQILTAAKILLESHRHDISKAVRNGEGNEGGISASSLNTAISHVETILQQVRTMSLRLRPTILDDCGLPAALRWLLDQHTKTTGRPVSFELKAYESEVEPAIETACFRIAQEALTNVSRHSKAQQVNVELQCDTEHLTLVVRDDGVGFDVTEANRRAHFGGSVGLLGQQERAALIGGKVEIRSQPGAGTEVWARFPLASRNCNVVSNLK